MAADPSRLPLPLNYMGNKRTDVLTTTYTKLAITPTNIVPYGSRIHSPSLPM
jgi:hypothetical protein